MQTRRETKESSCTSQMGADRRIRIRVRNYRYETLSSTLNRYPRSLLGCEAKRQAYYHETTDEIVFNRNAAAFDAILFYYQSRGILTRPPLISMEEFLNECNFFELEKDDIQRMKLVENYEDDKENQNVELVSNEKSMDGTSELLAHSNEQLTYQIWTGQNQSCIISCRKKLWKFLEEPSSSNFASFFAILSFLLISVSVFLSCSLTIPEIEKSRNPDLLRDPWAITELGLNVFFALEYFLRFITTPHVIRFLVSPLNLIDLLAFFPYFVVFILDPTKISSLSFLRMIRMVRVLRLLRLSKQSRKVAAVTQFLRESVKDIATLVVCYFISAVVFGSLEYYVETGISGTPFTSIPQSIWWAFQTLIPIGYGDIIPISSRGKAVGGSVAIFGAVTLTVPLLHLGGKYLVGYTTVSNVHIGKDCKPDIEPPPPGTPAPTRKVFV